MEDEKENNLGGEDSRNAVLRKGSEERHLGLPGPVHCAEVPEPGQRGAPRQRGSEQQRQRREAPRLELRNQVEISLRNTHQVHVLFSPKNRRL